MKKIGDKFNDNVFVIGHSKGGNFAVFASSLQDKALQDRIEHNTEVLSRVLEQLDNIAGKNNGGNK